MEEADDIPRSLLHLHGGHHHYQQQQGAMVAPEPSPPTKDSSSTLAQLLKRVSERTRNTGVIGDGRALLAFLLKFTDP